MQGKIFQGITEKFLHILYILIVIFSEGGEEVAAGRGKSDPSGEMENIISAYYEQIYKFCYWKIRGSEEAQDITQDTFIRFLDAAQTYSDIEKPKALLYTIANNLCLNWLRKTRPLSLDGLESRETPTADNFADDTIQKIFLSTAVSALPDKQQEVLLLRYGQDLKIGEIAEILGLSRFQVMYRIRKALDQLKSSMGREDQK